MCRLQYVADPYLRMRVAMDSLDRPPVAVEQRNRVYYHPCGREYEELLGWRRELEVVVEKHDPCHAFFRELLLSEREQR